MGNPQTYLSTLKQSRTSSVRRLPHNASKNVLQMTVHVKVLAVTTTLVALKARIWSIPPPSAPWQRRLPEAPLVGGLQLPRLGARQLTLASAALLRPQPRPLPTARPVLALLP